MQARYPMPKYGKYIDFLHISIDEGHKSLDMYDELEEYTKWGSIVTVQIVVTKNDIGALETKIRRCQDAGVKAVVMCAVHLKNTKDHLPDLWSMSKVGLELKKKYPGSSSRRTATSTGSPGTTAATRPRSSSTRTASSGIRAGSSKR